MPKSPFPAIGTYGFLSDCHTATLIAPDGSAEWLCAPRFDSPSVFGSILDRSAGSFRFGPKGVVSPLSRRYLPGTLVLETTWSTEDGWVVVCDALTIANWADTDEDGRPRVDHESDYTLVRWAKCIDGTAELDLRCHPRFNYGAEGAVWDDDGFGQAKTHHDDVDLYLATDLDLTLGQGEATGTLKLEKGETAFASLSWGEGIGSHPRSAPEARERIDATVEYWREWLDSGRFPDHPWRAHLQRSALVLKGLIYAPSGAIIAAATTSLPETPGGERNWDYRFSWIRDSTFALWSLHLLGFDKEARAFLFFVRDRAMESGDLQIMYGINGEHDLTESTLDHLTGYEGAKPVRIGNGAFDQHQHDVWGALMDSIYIHRLVLQPDTAATDENVALIARMAEAAITAWPTPDQGIWEARGEPKHYVSSKLMIWVAVDRAARIYSRLGVHEDKAERWRGKADEIKADILKHGQIDNVFRQHYDTTALDASVLLMPLVRFLPANDERIVSTVLAINEELNDGGLIMRYKVHETDDGLHGKEGTFLICSFWMVAALSEIGEPTKARLLCERLLSVAGTLDLYAEELETESNRHLGNFPQAFTHLALINAVSHVIADEKRDAETRGPTAVFSEMRN